MSTNPGWISVDEEGDPLPTQCSHLGEIVAVPSPPPQECMDCIVEGTTWVNLRQCLTCGGVRCCNDSPRKHATAHWNAVGHPLMRSAKPGEAWAWCFAEDLYLVPADGGEGA